MLPSLLGTNVVGKTSNPSYSMTGRSKNGGFDEDLQKVGRDTPIFLSWKFDKSLFFSVLGYV